MQFAARTTLGLLLALITLFSAPLSMAETVTKEDLAPGTLLNRYSGLAGTWWLDTKCRILTDDQKRELAWHISEISRAIANQTGKRRTLDALQKTAKQYVDEKFPDCPPNSRSLVIEGFERAQTMTKELTGQSYDPETSDRKRNLQTFALIAWWYHGVEGKCRHMDDAPENIRQKASEAWNDVFIMMVTKEKLPQANSVVAMVNEKIKSAPDLTCNDKTKIMVRRSVEEMFVLQTSLKNKYPQ
ncbi:MAG: hypothetical protein RIB80_11780 [Rhodospirillales bacterium]